MNNFILSILKNNSVNDLASVNRCPSFQPHDLNSDNCKGNNKNLILGCCVIILLLKK